MTWNCCKTTNPIAQKDYVCDASNCMHRDMCETDLDETDEGELQAYRDAKKDGWKILKGQKYIRTEGIWEGKASVFRARPGIDAICQKYRLYDE